MKRKLVMMCLVIALTSFCPVTVWASGTQRIKNDLGNVNDFQFEEMIEEIEDIKAAYFGCSDEKVLAIMNERHMETESIWEKRGVVDIWNALTDSEKKVMYPLSI